MPPGPVEDSPWRASDNGHTSGLRLFESDEKRAEQRQRRRRKNGWLPACRKFCVGAVCDSRRNSNRRQNCRKSLLIEIRFRQWLRHWTRSVLRGFATLLVMTAAHFTCFWTRRIRYETRRRGQTNGGAEQPDSEGHRNCSLPDHNLTMAQATFKSNPMRSDPQPQCQTA